MNDSLQTYVHELKSKGVGHDDIMVILAEAGWSRVDALSALRGEVMPLPPVPEGAAANAAPAASVPQVPTGPGLSRQADPRQPIAVVQNLSVRGFEYTIMFLTLWASAVSVGGLLHQWVNDAFADKTGVHYGYGDSSSLMGFLVTVLLVSFPIFIIMFIRLKHAEQKDADLRHDPSRRKLIQMTQLVAFLFGLGYIISFIYGLVSPDNFGSSPSVTENFLHTLITIVIAGGIFTYYWLDDHRKVK